MIFTALAVIIAKSTAASAHCRRPCSAEAAQDSKRAALNWKKEAQNFFPGHSNSYRMATNLTMLISDLNTEWKYSFSETTIYTTLIPKCKYNYQYIQKLSKIIATKNVSAKCNWRTWILLKPSLGYFLQDWLTVMPSDLPATWPVSPQDAENPWPETSREPTSMHTALLLVEQIQDPSPPSFFFGVKTPNSQSMKVEGFFWLDFLAITYFC